MMKVMIEKDKGLIHLPPYSTCRLCSNRSNQACAEKCAPARDYSGFRLKKGINLEDLPPFPLQEFMEEMSPKVRQVVIAVYMTQVIDHLQGVKHERPDLYHPIRRPVFETKQVQGVPPGQKRGDPAHPDRPEREDPRDRPAKVD
jgi:hypothetical protein